MLYAAAKLVVPKRMRPAVRDSVNALQARIDNPRRVARRRAFAMGYYRPTLELLDRWTREHSESSNFCYDITDASKRYLAHLLTLAFNLPIEEVQTYFRELEADQELHLHCERLLKAAVGPDVRFFFGRRLGWYAVARILKPRVIVETGVDQGAGACLLCAALMRNAAEGHPGRYFGTEIRPEAGVLFTKPYSTVGTILLGDSIDTLTRFGEPIDLFINDTDHSPVYEAAEYDTIRDKLSPRAVILGDNSHATTALAEFSERSGRRFVFFSERPKDHWYPGAGIGVSLPVA